MDFYSAYAQGFARVAAVTAARCSWPIPRPTPAAVIEQARACHDEHVAVAVFPELCLTGYSVDDLFLQDTLLAGVEDAIAEIVAASADLMTVLVVGAPIVQGNRVYNCAVVIHRGIDPRAWRRSPTCRTTASSTSAAGSRRATTASSSGSRSPTRTSGSAPT